MLAETGFHALSSAALYVNLLAHTRMQIIFGAYYPPELSDWWMDDWITVRDRVRACVRACVHACMHIYR